MICKIVLPPVFWVSQLLWTPLLAVYVQVGNFVGNTTTQVTLWNENAPIPVQGEDCWPQTYEENHYPIVGQAYAEFVSPGFNYAEILSVEPALPLNLFIDGSQLRINGTVTPAEAAAYGPGQHEFVVKCSQVESPETLQISLFLTFETAGQYPSFRCSHVCVAFYLYPTLQIK